MFSCKIVSPFRDGIKFSLCGLNYLNCFCVGNSAEIVLQKSLVPFRKTFLKEFGEEGYVITAFLHNICRSVLHEFLDKVKVVLKIEESHFRLKHPEFRTVYPGIRRVCPKCWTKGVYLSQREGKWFRLKLTAYSKKCFSSEVVFVVVNSTVLHGDHVQWKCCALKSLTCTLTVTLCYERRVDVEEAVIVKEPVYCHGNMVAYPKDTAECVGSGPEMGHCS